MRNKAFLIGTLLFLLTFSVDSLMFLSGYAVLGWFSVFGTLLVFGSAMIWLIYRDDSKLYLRRTALILPLAAFGFGVERMLRKIPLDFSGAPENLEEIGSLIMSRYQIALWVASTLILFMFVIASSVLSRNRA